MSSSPRDPEPFAYPLIAAGLALSVLAWSAVIGLAVARKGGANTVAMSATALVFLPVLAVAFSATERRLTRIGGMMVLWPLALFAGMPVFFPGERREALNTGLAMLTGDLEGDGVARTVAEALPDETQVAVVQVPPAEPVVDKPAPLPRMAYADNAIELPFEGDGRRISIPVVFEQGGRTVETMMMLDTGATYTTLPSDVLSTLGASPGRDAPTLTLNTANGKRSAQVALIDKVWLGDLSVGSVAVTSCEDCASSIDDGGNKGLLGLNVTSGFDFSIDHDRSVVVFTARPKFNRRLDVQPFSDLQARFERFPGGRVEVELDFANKGLRAIATAAAKVTCNDTSWLVQLDPSGPQSTQTIRRRLPLHERCETYTIVLDQADW
jgi:hypothetical protein